MQVRQIVRAAIHAAVMLLVAACDVFPLSPIAKAEFGTPEGTRNLNSYPFVKKQWAKHELDLVTTSFCRWVGKIDGSEIRQGSGMPDFIFLQCYFDQDWKQPLASDTRLNLRMAWKRNSNGQYERSEFFVETAYKNRIIRTKRDNCPTKDCKIEIQTLKFPATVDENLEFDFSVNTPIVDNNDKYMFNSRISFKGVAEFHRSI